MPSEVRELIGTYAESARLLGQRTAEMHLELGAGLDNPAFAPEPFTDHYRIGLYHGMIGRLTRTFELLSRRMNTLPAEVQTEARRVLTHQNTIQNAYRPVRDRRFDAMRIRTHGDITSASFSILARILW